MGGRLARLRAVRIVAFGLASLVFVQTVSAGSSIEWATPKESHILLSPGIQSFDVEVECKADHWYQRDFVHFLLAGEELEVDENVAGGSPSFRYWFWVPGTYAASAYCIGSDGEKKQPNDKVWNVEVPRTTSVVEPNDCTVGLDPTALANHTSLDSQWVAQTLIEHPELWHRVGPWACDFLAAIDPVDYSRQILASLLDVRARMEEIRFCDSCESSWDYAVSVVPEIEPLWEGFSSTHAGVSILLDSLQSLEAMANVRTAAVNFLVDNSTGSMARLQESVQNEIPDYLALISHVEEGARTISDLAGHARDVQDFFVRAAEEAESSGWTSWATDVLWMLSVQAAIVADVLESLADAVAHLAAPLSADVKILQAILTPPVQEGPIAGLPGLALGPILVAFIIAAGKRRRRKTVRDHHTV